MSLKLRDIVGDIFHTGEKEKKAQEQRSAELQQKIGNVFGTNSISTKQTFNPFLKKNGELLNPYLDYQKILDNPNVSQKAKNYITQATGLEPKSTPSVRAVAPSSVTPISIDGTPQTNPTTPTTTTEGTGEFKDSVGKRITDTSKYNNGAAKGQCVWYALGRASERNGKTITIGGNGNSMYYQAKDDAKVSASPNNLKGNMLLCYNKGTSSAGQKYGHVIFIEDVVGDTVYYTEGGSGYYKNGTDGVVKTATKEQIMKGVNSSGSRIGSEPVGLIDLSKY